MLRHRTFFRVAALLCVFIALAGCEMFHLYGALKQNEEYQTLLDMPPQYDDLQGKTVAVLVDADYATLYDHPDLIAQVTGGVSWRLQRDVPGVQVLNHQAVLNWQYRTPQWNALPYGEVTKALNVDRVIYVDIFEYRLNPPGNMHEWEGVAGASIGVLERDAFDPDTFVDSFTVSAEFPPVRHLTRQEASAQQIETALLSEFVKKTAWLFHQHLEPKYPDKYNPEFDTTRQARK